MSTYAPDTFPSRAGSADDWVYGTRIPDADERDLIGLKAKWLLKCIPQRAGLRVLDYGCGEGKHLGLIAKHRADVTLVGADIRQSHTDAKSFEFHLLPADGSLSVEDESVDVVVSCDVLEHVASIEHSLDEIRRVLRPRGAFIGFVPLEGGMSPHSLFRLIDKDIYKTTKDHVRSLTKRQMRNLLGSRFRLVQSAYSYHLFGASMDAVFFASFKLPVIGRSVEAFWRGSENACYHALEGRGRPSLIGRLTKLANTLAYYESKMLHDLPFGAHGLHFHVEKLDRR
jgi:ubiquinone/menaquinone biosynthesis C-methylase UbiE